MFQTYVDSLKKSGGFNKEAQIEAFTKAKDIALSQLTEDAKIHIHENYGSVDEWMRVQIEATIEILKNK